MVDPLAHAHPRMVEVLQKVEDLLVVAVDTPERSMVGQSLWEVEGPAAMELLAPVLLAGDAQEQVLALAVASEDARCPHSCQSSHEVGDLVGKLPLKVDPSVHPGLPGEPLVWRIEHGTALNRNFGERRSKTSESEKSSRQNDVKGIAPAVVEDLHQVLP